MNNLYLVKDGDEANNLDLFVVAMAPDQALEKWRWHYGLLPNAKPAAIHKVAINLGNCIPGPIAWGHMPNLIKSMEITNV